MPCEISTPRADIAQRFRWGALWVVGGRMAGIGVTLLANVVLARQLSPTGYGKFNLLASLIALLSLITMLGLSGAVVRFIPEQLAFGRVAAARRILRMAYLTTVATWGGIAAVVFAGWGWFAAKYELPSESTVVFLIAGSAGLIALLQLTAESLRGFHEIRFASLLSGGQTGGLLSNAVFVSLLLGCGYTASVSLADALTLNVISLSLIVPLAILLLVRTVNAYPVTGEMPESNPSHAAPGMAGIMAVCVPILLVQCVTLFASQADIFIAGAFCEQDLGLYSAARRLMLLVAMPLQMVNFLVISSIAELKAKKQWTELEGLLQTAGILAAVPSFIALTLLIVGGGPILEQLFGAAYRDAALPLAILALGQFVLTWAGSSHATLLMTGHQNVALAVNVVSAVLLIAGGSWAAHHHGIVGLACASAAVVIFENLVLMMLARRLLGIKTYVPGSLAKWSERLNRLDALGSLTARNRQDKECQESEVSRAD